MTRLPAIDFLRGTVIVLMALDHTRDYFSNELTINPTDLAKTNPALFYTRWITHFCAPVFVLLAGIGAAFTGKRMTKGELAKFLVLRGLWLVLLEFTLVRMGFYFTTDFRELQGLVIWTLGWCMVLLAALQYLPRGLLLGMSIAMIVGHNALDGLTLKDYGKIDWLWIALHGNGEIDLQICKLALPYKIVPLVGVMALGYCIAPVFSWPSRRKVFALVGTNMITAFLVVRWFRGYGDPLPWDGHSLMSLLNCEKYPPSLCYLLMTLGPAFVALAVFDREPGWLGRRLITLGRVPLFFYLLHLPLIHGLAVLSSWMETGHITQWLISPPAQAQAPDGYGYPIWAVYCVWLGVVAILYPLCSWYGDVKKRNPGGILSYF